MNTPEIQLRRATEQDIPSILELEGGLVGTKIYSGLTGSENAIKEITDNIFYLIIKDGKVVGDVEYRMKDQDHAYISGLGVAKEWQRQGIARRAMEMILGKLKEIEIVDLVTHPENEKAINLYKSLGFKLVGQPMENYFGDGQPRIKMVLQK